ncbi:unnamed protein product [Paramecium sonneborni]|uniref:Uncharacterized protein n=1 Tax=Paramecium sonneborni TaxID=65129 RepID=A0A8S1RUV7_9CILI|nr:unnamed protein product [Paramecium sonneborni]
MNDKDLIINQVENLDLIIEFDLIMKKVKFMKEKKTFTKYQPIFRILMNQKEKISDILGFLSKIFNLRFYESFFNNLQKISDLKKNIKRITNVLKNIQDHPISKIDYSTEAYEKSKQDLINKISGNKKIINFQTFLVHITSVDEKFIQCGSNGLNLLVGMRENLTTQFLKTSRSKILLQQTLILQNAIRMDRNSIMQTLVEQI